MGLETLKKDLIGWRICQDIEYGCNYEWLVKVKIPKGARVVSFREKSRTDMMIPMKCWKIDPKKKKIYWDRNVIEIESQGMFVHNYKFGVVNVPDWLDENTSLFSNCSYGLHFSSKYDVDCWVESDIPDEGFDLVRDIAQGKANGGSW